MTDDAMKSYGVTDKFAENRTMSASTMDKARERIEASAVNDALKEAAANAEDIVRTLTTLWGNNGLTPEQCMFALALATINFRETVPDKYGGKEMFDRVAHEAHKYYHNNK